jgi:hypothetical protein
MNIEPTKPKEIISLLIEVMTNAEKFSNLTGDKKKEYVIDQLSRIAFIEPNVKELIIELIDIIILLDKNKIKISKVIGCCPIC